MPLRIAQVYKSITATLAKDTRMSFKKLDQEVLNVVSVKNMSVEAQLGMGPSQ